MRNRIFNEQLLVSGLGKTKVILGFPWLTEQNPIIDWKTGHIEWRNHTLRFLKIKRKIQSEQATSPEITKVHPEATIVQISNKKEIPDFARQLKTIIEMELDEEEYKTHTQNPIEEDKNDILIELLATLEQNEVWINAKTNVAMQLAIAENMKKEDIPVTEIIPQEYHDYLNVFNEEQANRFPDSRPWDHNIEMKEGFEPKSFKNYNLTPAEQTEVNKFLKENLEKDTFDRH